jgi:hypothetical protein
MWGSRDEQRLLLWPRDEAVDQLDHGFLMRVADLLETDPPTANVWLRRGTPIRLGTSAEPMRLAHVQQGLSRLGLWSFPVRPRDLEPALHLTVATGAREVGDGLTLTDAEGAPIPLAGPVLVVRAELPAGPVQRDPGRLQTVRGQGDFASFEASLSLVDFFHGGGLVRMRADRFSFAGLAGAPEGLLPRLEWLVQRLLQAGSRIEGGANRMLAVERSLTKGREAPELESVIPQREWSVTEYGCAAFAGFRARVLPANV